MIKLTATGKPFGEAPGIAPPEASSWVMDQYRKYIQQELGGAIKETCGMAKECRVTSEELAHLMIEALDKENIPGLSRKDTIKLITEAIEKEMKS